MKRSKSLYLGKMTKEAIILAGGLGTRLQKITKNIPKSMVCIDGKPFLEYLFDYLNKQKIERVILAVCYKFEIIRSYFGNQYKELNIEYSIEKEPLGTGGGIKRAIRLVKDKNVFVLNGDSFFNVNLENIYKFHKSMKSELTLALKPMKEIARYGIVKIGAKNKIIGFEEKKYKDFGFINGGIYLLNIDLFEGLNLHKKFSLENDFLEKYYNCKHFYGIIFDEEFIDIGIPEDYERAKNELLYF